MIDSIIFKLYKQPRANILYNLWKKPYVESIFHTLQELIDGKSIARFGDGEFDIIKGTQIGFQQPNKRLGDLLKSVLETDDERLLIGIPGVYREQGIKLNKKTAEYWKWYRIYNIDFIKHLLDNNRVYADSFISRFYSSFESFEYSRVIDMYRKIWDKKDVYIIEGEKTRVGVGNDLLSNANSINRILAPAKNAFNSYDKILDKATSIIPIGSLVILALGPTATVLARDLCLKGYQALDLGHIDLQYEYFVRKTSERVLIPGKFVNEVKGGDMVSDINLPVEYFDSIRATILD